MSPIRFRTFNRVRQNGQSMVEYALILVLVSVVVIAVLVALGTQIKEVFVNVIRALGGS